MQTTTRAARPGEERKRPDRRPKKQAQPKKAGPQTAQQTIPYREIFKDGICRVTIRVQAISQTPILKNSLRLFAPPLKVVIPSLKPRKSK